MVHAECVAEVRNVCPIFRSKCEEKHLEGIFIYGKKYYNNVFLNLYSGVDEVSVLMGCSAVSYPRRTDISLLAQIFKKQGTRL